MCYSFYCLASKKIYFTSSSRPFENLKVPHKHTLISLEIMHRSNVFIRSILVLSFFLFTLTSYSQTSTVAKAPNTAKVIHQIQKGETLYSLLRKYNCSLDEFKELNPDINLEELVLSINQEIFFPVPMVSSVQKAKSHVVKEKETLFAISRLYDVPVNLIQQWNNLTDENLKPGQELVLTGKVTPEMLSKPIGTMYGVDKRDLMAVPVTELGIAEVIKTQNKSDKHVALHREAPIGSLVKVRNEATGASVLVKVIGTLPEIGENHGVMIRVSPAAFVKLQPKDNRLRAEISYMVYPK